jgi:diguanylate cyclase (GGDEF)-like protein
MGTDPQAPASEEESARRRQAFVWLLAATMAAFVALIVVPGAVEDPWLLVPGAAWFALLPLFALAEVWVIHLPTQRNAHGHTLREVPAVLGLTFLAPHQYVTAYVVGAVAALVVAARMRGVKLAFNASMFALEAALGAVAYHAILQGGDPLTYRGWAAVLVAVLVTDLISAAAVTAAISLMEGAFDGEVLDEALRSGMVAAFINTCVALLVATLVLVQPSALPLLGVVIVLLVLGYRVYVTLARGHARTQLLYRFVDRTSSAASSDGVIEIILVEAAELMHAERAYLVELLDDGRLRSHALEQDCVRQDTLRLDGRTAWWWPAFEGVVVHHVAPPKGQGQNGDTSAEPSGRPALLTPPCDGLAGPLREAGSTRYVLVVCDRSFDKESFGPDDVQVFEALTVHAGVALERARSISDLETLAEERTFEARHDPLSGLLNRRAFNDAVAEALQSDPMSGVHAAGVVMLLDLDDFKDVNDTLGHSAGDRIITVTADRLRDEAFGLVSRLGGDEFAVLVPGLTLEDGLIRARKLHSTLCQPVPLDGVHLTVSASIGVAAYNVLTESAEDLLAQADVAMYTAKADRSGVAPYHPAAGDSTARRLTLAADLPRAVEERDVVLWYQPQADPETGRITGFEALVRWNHPEFGMISPPEIIAVAHRTGHMRRLTDALICQALEARRGWSRAGHDVDVSVNVTPRDVSDPALVELVRQSLAATGTPAHALVLEITESDAMRDPERSLQVLSDIHALGVQLSIDDFGTGYSSLAYLDRLPVSEVKIDRSFVFRLERDAADATIVRATVGLAHDLGLRVVAEGVETELARTLVRRLGVDVYQGYGLARPMPGAEVLAWLARHDDVVGRDEQSAPAFVLEIEAGTRHAGSAR